MFKSAVLIIHGFMGDISEVEYLLNYIKLNTNIDSYSFSLPGHDKYTLKNVEYTDWMDASREMLKKLKKKYNTIYIIGHSMGAVIGSVLAIENPEIKKLVLVAPAYIYLDLNENIGNIKSIIKSPIKNKEKYFDVTHKVMSTSILSMLEFRKLVEKYYDTPQKIKCNILILHGEKDPVVPLKSCTYVYENVLSKDKHLTIIEGETHALLYGNKKEEIARYISSYLKGGIEWKIAKNLKI